MISTRILSFRYSEGKLDRVQFIDDINYLTDPLSGVDLILLQKESFWCDSDRDGAKCWIILVQVRVFHSSASNNCYSDKC